MENINYFKKYSWLIIILLIATNVYSLTDKKGGSEEIKLMIDNPVVNKITAQGKYSLDCASIKYTMISIGGFLIPESTINISIGSEKQVLYVENDIAKYFGAEYKVLQDTADYLVIIRFYPASGLTEVVSINKESGVGYDTNTKTLGLTGGPTTATYLISCSQI